MFECVRADIHRLRKEETSIVRLGTMLFNQGLHAVLLYRLSRWFYLHRMRPVAILVNYFNGFLNGAQISCRATIGKGLSIYHPQGIVVGATAVIGNFCTLVHGNVIGQLHGDEDRPIIGDHFYAGTGAKILGKVRIGNHVSVGPNVFLIRSVPDNVMVTATPARIYFGPASSYSVGNGRSLSRQALLQRVSLLVTSTVEIAARANIIDENTELLGNGIGLDSVEILKLICAIEEEFHLTFDDREIQASDFQTLGSLATLIQERLSQ